MLGKKRRQQSIFYFFRIEDFIPKDHILKLINRHIDFSFIYPKVKHLYSHTGRPSIDPVVLIKMLLIGYLFGITSERKLCEEVSMHIGYRWFIGLDMNDKVPDHSSFSKNRHGRFKESDIFQEIFDEIVRRCIEFGLVSGRHITADGTLVKANASMKSMEPIVVEMDSKEYIKRVEEENLVDEPWEPDDEFKHRGERISNKTHRSKTDPDAKLARKGKSGAVLAYGVNYLMDNKNRIIVGVKAEKPDKGGEMRAAIGMIRGVKWKYKLRPKTLGGDKGYSAGEFLYQLINEGITPHIPVKDTHHEKEKGIYPIEEFKYDADRDEYICPQGKSLKYHGIQKLSRQIVYRASVRDCKSCCVKGECTRDRARSISKHIYREYITYAIAQTRTFSYRVSQRKRKQIEGLFGEAKEQMGLRVAKFRRRWNVEEQFIMTALAQNIKRMVKLLEKMKGDQREAVKEGIETLRRSNYSLRLSIFLFLIRLLVFVSIKYMELCPR